MTATIETATKGLSTRVRFVADADFTYRDVFAFGVHVVEAEAVGVVTVLVDGIRTARVAVGATGEAAWDVQDPGVAVGMAVADAIGLEYAQVGEDEMCALEEWVVDAAVTLGQREVAAMLVRREAA